MPPLLLVSTLESSACSTLSRLLAQAFSRLEANDRRTRRQKAGGQEDEKEVGEILDCLPTAVLESATQKVLDMLTSKVVAQPGCSGGWYTSRVRGGVTTTIPGLAAALRSGNLFAEISVKTFSLLSHRLLPRPATSSFDIGGFISVARLSRSFTSLCEKSLQAGEH